MAKTKGKSAAGKFPAGGKGKMFEKGTAHPAVAGQSGKSANGGGNAKFPKGGSGNMFGKGTAHPAVAGRSGKTSNG